MVLSLLRDKSLLLLSEEEYLILLAPASGVFLAITVNAICKYRRHQKRFNNKIFKFNKPIKTPVYNPLRDIVQKVIVLKVSYLHGKIILTCSKLNRLIFIMLQKSPIDFSFYTIAIWKTTEVVIVLRACLLYTSRRG